ncbi:AIPR family protein [Brachyspira hyodysenteriae]|nr:AIPR family protein [Brachyspira hyodysenteriae]MDA0062453.1 AIPR family protein [Brachyspira hyodysenteriae]
MFRKDNNFTIYSWCTRILYRYNTFERVFNLVCDNDRIIKSIFYDNVRDYQGDTIVNKEIANTMLNENESKYFGLYHNGVTIVAKTLKRQERILL